jgi:hypothetical protein
MAQVSNFKNQAPSIQSHLSQALIGHWKVTHSRMKQEDGVWVEEKVFGGGMVFTENFETLMFVRTSEGPWGFSGAYSWDGDELDIVPDAALAPDLEGRSLHRKIKFISDREMLWSGTDAHTGRDFEVVFVR